MKIILAELFSSSFKLKQREYSLKSELNEINVRFEHSPQIYLNNIKKFSSFPAENILHMNYKNQLVNALREVFTVHMRIRENSCIHSAGKVFEC
jgi:hypothetical protein